MSAGTPPCWFARGAAPRHQQGSHRLAAVRAGPRRVSQALPSGWTGVAALDPGRRDRAVAGTGSTRAVAPGSAPKPPSRHKQAGARTRSRRLERPPASGGGGAERAPKSRRLGWHSRAQPLRGLGTPCLAVWQQASAPCSEPGFSRPSPSRRPAAAAKRPRVPATPPKARSRPLSVSIQRKFDDSAESGHRCLKVVLVDQAIGASRFVSKSSKGVTVC